MRLCEQLGRHEYIPVGVRYVVGSPFRFERGICKRCGHQVTKSVRQRPIIRHIYIWQEG